MISSVCTDSSEHPRPVLLYPNLLSISSCKTCAFHVLINLIWLAHGKIASSVPLCQSGLQEGLERAWFCIAADKKGLVETALTCVWRALLGDACCLWRHISFGQRLLFPWCTCGNLKLAGKRERGCVRKLMWWFSFILDFTKGKRLPFFGNIPYAQSPKGVALFVFY